MSSRACFLVSLLCGVVIFPCLSSAQRVGAGKTSSGSHTVPLPSYRRVTSTLMPRPLVRHADDEGKVDFRSETILVQVPLIVTDHAGDHVRGLGRDDFEILENGKTQKIAGFEEIETSQVPIRLTPETKGQFSNFDGRGEASRNVTVIAFDTINTPFLDQTYGRRQLIKYLAENLPPGQNIALVAITTHGTKVIHNFSSDTASLIRSLQQVKGELSALEGVDIDTRVAAAAGSDFNYPAFATLSSTGSTDAQLKDFVINGDAAIVRLQQDRAVEQTLRGFQDIAFSLSGVPGKKSLIWATGGFPFAFDSPQSIPFGILGDVYERVIQTLTDAEISVYPVDLRGLLNTSVAADASYSSGFGNGRGGNVQFSRSWLLSSSFDTLNNFAAMTGGRAFYNTNDVSKAFGRAMSDGSDYYVLSYYLDTSNRKAGWRQLKVKLHKPGTEVRARGGFFVTAATTDPNLTKKSDIAYALHSPFDSTGIALTLRFKDVTSDGHRQKVNYVLHVAPEGVTVDGVHDAVNLEVVGVAIKGDRAEDDFQQTIAANFKDETLAKLRSDGLAYSNALELPAGQYKVRFVVRDNVSGKIGSLTAPLTVN